MWLANLDVIHICIFLVSVFEINLINSMEVIQDISGYVISLKKSETAIFQTNSSKVQISISSDECESIDTEIEVIPDKLCIQDDGHNNLTDANSMHKWYSVTLMNCDRPLLKLGGTRDFILLAFGFHQNASNSNCKFKKMEFTFSGITRLALIISSVADKAACLENAAPFSVEKKWSYSSDASLDKLTIKCMIKQVTSLLKGSDRNLIFITAIMICTGAVIILCYIDHVRQRAMNADTSIGQGNSQDSFNTLTFFSPGMSRRLQPQSALNDYNHIQALSITGSSRPEMIPFHFLTTSSGSSTITASSQNMRPLATRQLTIMLPQSVRFQNQLSNTRRTSSTPVLDTNSNFSLTNSSPTTEPVAEITVPLPEQRDAPPSYEDVQEEKKMQVIIEENEAEPPSYWDIKTVETKQ